MAKTKIITVKRIDDGNDSMNAKIVEVMNNNDYDYNDTQAAMEFTVSTFKTKKRIPAGELASLQRKLKNETEDQSIEVSIE